MHESAWRFMCAGGQRLQQKWRGPFMCRKLLKHITPEPTASRPTRGDLQPRRRSFVLHDGHGFSTHGDGSAPRSAVLSVA